VAAQYGGPYTAEYLEQYRHNGLKYGLPTPAISPQSNTGSPIPSCPPEEVGTPGSMKSMNIEAISELPTPQPLNASCPPTPAAEAEPAQADIESDDTTALADL